MTSCELNQIFLGEIASVQNYGAFVRIPGCKQQGLIHKSQVSSSRVDDVADILQRGERVWCKVINIGDNGKVGLSMKHVNQGSGKDLDPNGAEQQLDEQRRKKMVLGQRKAIELEAVLDTTCSKCGTRGHLASDCFMTPDGKKYDLIPEIEETIVPAGENKIEREEKSASSKKLKRRKKSKKLRENSDGSSDNDSGGGGGGGGGGDDDSGEPKRKRRKKKRSKESKKKKKRKHSESWSDSSDSPDDQETKGRRESGGDKKSKKCKHSRSKHSD